MRVTGTACLQVVVQVSQDKRVFLYISANDFLDVCAHYESKIRMHEFVHTLHAFPPTRAKLQNTLFKLWCLFRRAVRVVCVCLRLSASFFSADLCVCPVREREHVCGFNCRFLLKYTHVGVEFVSKTPQDSIRSWKGNVFSLCMFLVFKVPY